MAVEEKKVDVIMSDLIDSGGKNVLCGEAEHNPPVVTEDCNEEEELGVVDSGTESDETDLLELGDVGGEFCLVEDQTCSIPLELYDLPDLRDILSLDVWNDCLSEEERLELALYLPDMDKGTFMWTLKELLSGDNFHFGSPVHRLFEMMKGGLCEPRVALYRQGLNMLQKCRYYHQLRNHHNNMVSSMYQIRDVWIRCRGYKINEKLQKLKNFVSKKTSVFEKTDDFGLDGSLSGRNDPDRDIWSQTLMETRARQKNASHVEYHAASGHLSLKQNPKAMLKQAKPLSPARQPAGYPPYIQYGSSSAFPKHCKKARGDINPSVKKRKKAEQVMFNAFMHRDKDDSIHYVSQVPKLRKRQGYLGENESRSQNLNDFPLTFSDFIVNGDSHQVNQLSDITVLTTKPCCGGTSNDFGKKVNYFSNIHAYTSDQKKGGKGKKQAPGSAVLGTPSGSSDPSNLFWRSNNQPEAFTGDQSAQDKWETRTKRPQMRHNFLDLDMKYEPAASLSNYRENFHVEYLGGNCVQNGAPDMTALRGIRSISPSDETESDSSKHINDVNPTPNKESTYHGGEGSNIGYFGLENAKYLTKKKNSKEYDLGEERHLDTQLVDTFSKKGKHGSHAKYISLKATEDVDISDKGTSNKNDLERKKYVIRRTRDLLGELGERSIVLESLYPLDMRQNVEFEHDPSLNPLNECGDNGFNSAEAENFVGNQNGQQLSAKKRKSKVFASDELANAYITSSGCSWAANKRKRSKSSNCMEPEYEYDLYSDPQETPLLDQDVEGTEIGSHDMGTSDTPCTEVETTNVELEAKVLKTRFTLITPTVHTGLPFSVVHLLSAVRVIMTSQSDDPLVVSQPLEESMPQMIDSVENKENDNQFVPQVPANVPSLTIQEIVNRMRSNPGDPCILETEEPLQDLVRGVLKIFSSKRAPLGAKDWKPLAAYRKSTRSWYWIGPVLQNSLSDQENPEEVTSPDAWGIPRKTLVKLVDSFANWLVSSQEVLKQLGSLPAPPDSLFQLKLEENDRFGDQRVQKSSCTFEPSSEEVRDYFRREEALRYSIPDRAFRYTAADGSKSMVAPLRRCGGKPTSKPREHYLLKPDRPPHVTILCLVRDAAARLPGCVGTRSDICTLMRDSQYIVEDVPDSQLNQIVSGALDRLHYEHDPCVRYENERKIWVYLHRERVEEDFDDDGTPGSRRWKRQKDPSQPPDQDKIAAASDQDAEDQTGLANTDSKVEPATYEEDIIVDIM